MAIGSSSPGQSEDIESQQQDSLQKHHFTTMATHLNITLQGQTDKPITADVFYNITYQPKPIVVFCHGYKGFKDWGAWNLVADKFAQEGFFFIKFNFSHNGGTPENPIDFPDLEAFAEDNYSKQLADLETVIDWITTTKKFVKEADVRNLNLIGHSRGGGIVLLKAASNKHVTKVASWAGVSDFASRFPQGQALEKWKENGIYYVKNSRTKQQMPHHYQFYKDFESHKEQLNIKKAVRHLKIPQLIIHAADDTSVVPREAKKLKQWNKKSKLSLINSGGHTFGTKHPWTKSEMPKPLHQITQQTIQFFNS